MPPTVMPVTFASGAIGSVRDWFVVHDKWTLVLQLTPVWDKWSIPPLTGRFRGRYTRVLFGQKKNARPR
jgi:hypothetical protein